MSVNAGDIVVSLGMDTQDWFDKASAIGRSARQLGGSIKTELSAGIKSGLANIAVDVIGGISRGGNLESVALSAGTAVAGSIAEGMAKSSSKFSLVIGAAVTALGAVLAKKYQESADALRTFTAEIDANSEALNKNVSAARGAIDAADRLSKLRESGTPGDLKAARGGVETDLKKLEAERTLVNSALTDAVRLAGNRGYIDKGSIRGSLFLPNGDINPNARFSLVGDAGGASDTIIGLSKRFNELNELIPGRKKELADLDALAPDVATADKARERATRAAAFKDADLVLRTGARFDDLADLAAGGEVDPAVALRAATGLRSSLAGALNPSAANRANPAAIGGTASGFSSLQASLRESKTAEEGLSDIARQQLNRMDQFIRKQEELINAVNGQSTPTEGMDGGP
jgi:hypothetical protein